MRTVLAALLVVAPILAGCFAAQPTATIEGEGAVTVSRVVTVHVDASNWASVAEAARDPSRLSRLRYDFLEPELVVTFHGETAPHLLTLRYTDREGRTTTKPFTEVTSLPLLKAGDSVRVPAHPFSGAVLKTTAGVVLANRSVEAPQWWSFGGAPLGVHMKAGSEVVYASRSLAAHQVELTSFSLRDAPYAIDRASLAADLSDDGTLRFAHPREVADVDGRRVRPLDVSWTGSTAFPITVEVQGRNLTTGQPVDGGIEVLPGSGVAYDLAARVWIGEDGAPVRADLRKLAITPQADAIAWLTGVREAEGEIDCAGAGRASQCRPDGVERAFGEPWSLEPQSFPLSDVADVVDAAFARDLRAYFADGLYPGDKVVWRVQLSGADVSGDPDAAPFRLLDVEATTTATRHERVTVPAGAYDAIRVDSLLEMRILTNDLAGPDGMTLGALDVHERVYDATTWLERGTFLPVKAEASIPVDLGRVVGEVLDAMDRDGWAGTPFEPIASRNLDWTATSSMRLELTKDVGESRMAPWLMVGGFPLFLVAHDGFPAHLLDQADAYSSWSDASWE